MAEPARAVDRRQALQKLAVGSAIIWGAPLIVGSAPALAAGSVCGPRVLEWRSVAQMGSVTFPLIAVLDEVTLTITEQFYGNSSSFAVDRDVRDGPIGGVGSSADSFVRIHNNAVKQGGRRLTFSFTATGTSTPKPVKNISLWLTDIDRYSANGNYDDRVSFVPATFTRENPPGSTVGGSGGPGNQAFRNDDVVDPGFDKVRGTIRVTQAAAISSFVLDYWCGNGSGGGNQTIFFSDVSFNSCA